MKILVIIFIFLINILSVYGQCGSPVSSGPNSGTTFVDAGTGSAPWVNPANAGAADNVYATETFGGFAVPSGLRALTTSPFVARAYSIRIVKPAWTGRRCARRDDGPLYRIALLEQISRLRVQRALIVR